MRPVVGRTSPLNTLNSVVLPAPLGPINPTISPRGISKLTEESATSPPKHTESRSTSSSRDIEGAIELFLTCWPLYRGDVQVVILELLSVLVNDLRGMVQWGPPHPSPLPEGALPKKSILDQFLESLMI